MKKHILILSSALLCISAFAQVPNYVPTNGLVGYWPFNGNANDESGNGNNGTVNGLVSFSNDRNGVSNSSCNWPNSLSTSNYINLNNLSQYIPNSISISCWFYIDGATANSRIISCGEMGLIVHQDLGNSVYLKCSYDPAGSQIWPSSFLVSKNNWHHIVFTSNYTTNIAELYIDGIHADTEIGGVPSSQQYYDWNVGRKSISGFDGYGGGIDDISIWNRALTQCEIQDLYHAQLNSAVGISAGPDQTVCEGEFITLNGSGGTNYVWNNSVVDGVPFIPTASMDYPFLGQDANGCIGTDTMHVELIPTSSSTLTETALDSYTLNGQTYTQSGTYTQVIPNAAGCDSTITLNLSLDFTGISELNKDFSIAPNPATDQITISTNTLSNEKYILFDPQGRKVLEGSLTGTTTQLDLSKLAGGNYLLQIGEKLTPVQLVKE